MRFWKPFIIYDSTTSGDGLSPYLVRLTRGRNVLRGHKTWLPLQKRLPCTVLLKTRRDENNIKKRYPKIARILKRGKR